MNLVDELHGICRVLTQAGVAYAVCGGVAVTIHGATRSTKDIDLLVGEDDLERVLELIRPLGYRYLALPMVFDEGTPRERHVQRVSKLEGGAHLVVDLLLAKASFSGFLEGAVRIEVPEGPLTVVSREVLITMKRMAGRPQDVADLEKLEEADDA